MSQTTSQLFLEGLLKGEKPTERQIISSLIYTINNAIGEFKSQTIKILLLKTKVTKSSLEKIERILEIFLQDKTIVTVDSIANEINAVLNYTKTLKVVEA